jgi:hypothetical protein
LIVGSRLDKEVTWAQIVQTGPKIVQTVIPVWIPVKIA